MKRNLYAQLVDTYMTLKKEIQIQEYLLELHLKIYQMIGFVHYAGLERKCLKKQIKVFVNFLFFLIHILLETLRRKNNG